MSDELADFPNKKSEREGLIAGMTPNIPKT